MQGRSIHITGIVQGVGFRPFVYGLALRYGLKGWVRNTSEGVTIRVDGSPDALRGFIAALRNEAPPLAHIDTLTVTAVSPADYDRFDILESQAISGAMQPISPDIALCADCLNELRDPDDRRYRYPFINCTNCGPRFTIIRDIPYDRPQTTMAAFAMCDACAAEYHNASDRRFHAQPVACADCGPQVWLETGTAHITGDAAIQQAAELLRDGAILAIKGLGGFHLACDATDAAAVNELRRRKHRVDKPFALMMADLDQVRAYCHVSDDEAALLGSAAAPIVLLWRRTASIARPIAETATPRQATLGVMLPYTPLHALIFDTPDMPPLIMTSGNHAEEPIVTTNAAARDRLDNLADAFLMHDRDIHIRTDDSVMRVWQGAEMPLRRSRGYAPFPVKLPVDTASVLAVGGEMKNAFCLTRANYAFMSHHIGEMGHLGTLRSFEDGVHHFEGLFRATPGLIVHDMHPDYAATRYALSRAAADDIPTVAVQHHHAHIAACMVENGFTGDAPVIGVCFDGTGYGPDGTIWGGEFLMADYAGYERLAHLKPMPLPGGDASTRKPARIAHAYLHASGLSLSDDLPPAAALPESERRVLVQQITRGINTPLTSSMGRLFDAVSSLIGLCQTATYEGQAAIELEAVAAPEEDGAYPLPDTAPIDPAPLLAAVIADYRAQVPPTIIAARFHNSIARMITAVCERLAAETGIHDVALTGGVFQNVTLLGKAVPRLEAAGLRVITHRVVPPNDGGLALGQAMIGHVQANSI